MRSPAAGDTVSGRLHDWLYDHRPAVLVVFAILLSIAGAGIPRVQPVHDVSSLINGDAGFERAAALLSELGTMDTLLIDVTTDGDVAAAADKMAAALEQTGDFKSVLFRIEAEAQRTLVATLFPRRFFLFAPPKDLGPGLDAAARDLMMPGGGLEGLVYRDPVGLRERLFEMLTAAAPRANLDTSAGTLMSPDGRHALIVVEPATRALDTATAADVLERIAKATPEGATVQVLGAHVFAVAAASAIKRDVRLTVAATLLLVIILFGLVFRSPLPVLAVNLPVIAGGVTALGAVGWFGLSLHGITMGFGAVMIGIGIDYGAHLVMHARAHRTAHPGDTPRAAMRATYVAVAPSITFGALTTLVAFLALALSGIAALEELVIFTGMGVTGCFLTAIFVLPLLPELAPPGRVPRSASKKWTLPPRVVLGVGAALTLVMLVGLGKVQFDGNVRHLDYQPPHIRAIEAEMAERWDHPRHPTLVVAHGATDQEALVRSDRVTRILEQAERRGDVGSFTSLSRILPSETLQLANRALWDATALKPALTVAADARGLNVAAFDPFFADLNAPASPLQPADLKGSPLENLSRRMLVTGPDATRALAVVHQSGTAHREVPPEVRDALTALGNVDVVSAAGLARGAVTTIKNAVAQLSLLSLLFVGLVLLFYYRRARPVVFALLPILVGFAWTWGLMGLLGIPFNIVSIGAFALVAGVGVDYGIFMTDAQGGDVTRRAVMLAAATTLVGFGTLMLAKSPVMWSLGFAVTAGVLTSVLVAVVGLPAIWAVAGSPHPAPRRPLRRLRVLQLIVVVGLAVALVTTWLMGARSTHGWQVGLALAVDVAYAIWLTNNLHR